MKSYRIAFNDSTPFALKLADMLLDLTLLKKENINIENGSVENVVFNTDPFSRDDLKDRIHAIREVYKNKANLIGLSFNNLKNRMDEIIKKNWNFPIDMCVLNSIYNAFIEPWMKCLYHNFPLALIYLRNDFIKPNSFFSLRIFRTWRENIRIKNDSIVRLLRLNPNKVYLVLLMEQIYDIIPAELNLKSIEVISNPILSKGTENAPEDTPPLGLPP